MTIDKLIEIADRAYPDGMILTHWNPRRHRPLSQTKGDTLALFIVRELFETFELSKSDEEQLLRACEALRTARAELDHVVFALESELRRKPGSLGDIS